MYLFPLYLPSISHLKLNKRQPFEVAMKRKFLFSHMKVHEKQE